MNGARLDTLAMASISSGNGSLSRIVKFLPSAPVISSTTVASVWPRASRAIQRWSEAVQSGRPTRAADRLAVMEFEPVTQGETVAELVRRDIVVADHLRMRFEFGVERKQRVEHHIAVIAGDVCCRPYRIEHAQIRLGDKTQGLRVGGARRPAQTKA